MKIEIDYYEEIITITAYNEKDKKEIIENLEKDKKIYEIYQKVDIEDLTTYYLIIIFRELKRSI